MWPPFPGRRHRLPQRLVLRLPMRPNPFRSRPLRVVFADQRAPRPRRLRRRPLPRRSTAVRCRFRLHRHCRHSLPPSMHRLRSRLPRVACQRVVKRQLRWTRPGSRRAKPSFAVVSMVAGPRRPSNNNLADLARCRGNWSAGRSEKHLRIRVEPSAASCRTGPRFFEPPMGALPPDRHELSAGERWSVVAPAAILLSPFGIG